MSNAIESQTGAPESSRVTWREDVDRSTALVVMLFFVSSVLWLLIGSGLALLASIKLHTPGFLADWAWATFGRIRPAHLNTVIYGWGSMAGIGVLLWLTARLCRVTLPLRLPLVVTCVLWNVAVAGGTWSILAGYGTSVEWLEFPYHWSFVFAGLFGVLMSSSLTMFTRRRVSHIGTRRNRPRKMSSAIAPIEAIMAVNDTTTPAMIATMRNPIL